MKSQEKIENYLIKLYKTHESDFRLKSLRILLLKYLKRGNVLDHGCGTGHAALELLKNNFKVSCYDISVKLLMYADKYLKSNGYNVVMYSSKKQIREKFDNVISSDVLEHIQNDVSELKYFYNILNKNGKLVLTVPAYPFLYSKRDDEIGHFRRYSKKEIINELKTVGFKIIKSRYWNFIFLPITLFYGKILKKRIPESIRNKNRLINKILFMWFKYIENNIDFHSGLSLIIVAEKK